MRHLSISSAIIVLLVCSAVASAGVVGTYAIIAPLVASAEPETSEVRIFVDDYLPVRLRKYAGGAVQPAAQGTINFVREGVSVQQVNVGLSGTTQVSNLGYGPYSLFVSGPDGFAAFGTWIAPASDGMGAPGAGIDVALIPGSDMGVVRQIIDDHLQFGGPSVVKQEPTPAENVEENLVNTNEDLVANVAGNRDLIQGHGFEMRQDGSVVGKIARSAPPSEPEPPVPGLDVYFIKSGQIAAEGRTDFDGVFQVSGLSPGFYSLVVAGSDAFVALAGEVHPYLAGPAADAGQESLPVTRIQFNDRPNVEDEVQQVSMVANQTTIATVSPVFSSDLGFLGPGSGFGSGDGLAAVPPGEMPFGPGAGGGVPGGTGGGFGGGGGGPFGGEGLGALLGAGALGLAAAALADNNNDGTVIQVVSPAVP
ncbi:MAG: hypothetical protein KDA86_11030 [Planctomycetaceae bacterium]|nr:hypothetical protein [Planctomycetaceae bacterium]